MKVLRFKFKLVWVLSQHLEGEKSFLFTFLLWPPELVRTDQQMTKPENKNQSGAAPAGLCVWCMMEKQVQWFGGGRWGKSSGMDGWKKVGERGSDDVGLKLCH